MTIDELRRDLTLGTLTPENAKALIAALDVVEAAQRAFLRPCQISKLSNSLQVFDAALSSDGGGR